MAVKFRDSGAMTQHKNMKQESRDFTQPTGKIQIEFRDALLNRKS